LSKALVANLASAFALYPDIVLAANLTSDELQGKVTDINDRGFFSVNFDDGRQQWLLLDQENFRLLGPRTPTAGLSQAMQVPFMAVRHCSKTSCR
jgi:hypothetical protein